MENLLFTNRTWEERRRRRGGRREESQTPTLLASSSSCVAFLVLYFVSPFGTQKSTARDARKNDGDGNECNKMEIVLTISFVSFSSW